MAFAAAQRLRHLDELGLWLEGMRRPGVEGILELLLGVTVAGVVPHTAPLPEDREGPGETFRSVGRGIRLGPRRVNEDKGTKGIATRVHAVEDHIRALEL